MTTPTESEPPRDTLPSPWLDLTVRLALIAGLVAWSIQIIRPFFSPLIWGAVLAVTVHPFYEKVSRALGGRNKSVAVSFVIVPLLLFAAPVIVIAESLVDDVMRLNHAYQSGEALIPPPNPTLKDFPIAGERLFSLWTSAHEDLHATIGRLSPQLLELRASVLAFARGITALLFTFLFSLIVMAAFLLTSEQMAKTTRGLSIRVAGNHGDPLVSLARDTIRSVAKGIVGVALIQALLGGVGCVVAGVPMAGLWALVILVLAVAQLPTIFVLLPLIYYVFQNSSTPVAIVFAIWSILVGLVDNVLKPLLMGRGVEAPMLIVFLGAIGGMLSAGVLGLFVGPVVLVVTFTLAQAWARQVPEPKRFDAAPEQSAS
jgi:predicted PurR-regulated permease PerM